ncbi:MAG TPA: hypothetical protein VMT25_02670 [Thermoanaerobaculia bacterium]|nr:hypothetical protein [Thermoanaerobaculia bacterium]
MSDAPDDVLRRLARERGRILGELGLQPSDAAWARSEADAIASLVTPALRLPAFIDRFLRRLARLAG